MYISSSLGQTTDSTTYEHDQKTHNWKGCRENQSKGGKYSLSPVTGITPGKKEATNSAMGEKVTQLIF